MLGPRLKAFAEKVLQQALSAADPERSVREALQLTERFLVVRGVPHRLEPTSQLVVIALGKAAASMARGALAVLGGRVTRCVVVPKADGWSDRAFAGCRVIPGAHPVPDARSLEAGQALLDAVRGLHSTDLVLVLLSGGGSALAEVPRESLALDDLVLTTDELLRAGADIWLLNAVRRRLSAIKGGGLARAAAPARVVNLIVSDVLGNPLPVIASGPTVEPRTTFRGCRRRCAAARCLGPTTGAGASDFERTRVRTGCARGRPADGHSGRCHGSRTSCCRGLSGLGVTLRHLRHALYR
jgi:glycerate 2-kinase